MRMAGTADCKISLSSVLVLRFHDVAESDPGLIGRFLNCLDFWLSHFKLVTV